MAKSLKAELDDILRLEERAEADLRRARAKREKLIAPTRARISGAFGERLDAFLRKDLARMTGSGLRFEREAFVVEIDRLLERCFGANPRRDEDHGNAVSTKVPPGPPGPEDSPPEQDSVDGPFSEDAGIYLDGDSAFGGAAPTAKSAAEPGAISAAPKLIKSRRG